MRMKSSHVKIGLVPLDIAPCGYLDIILVAFVVVVWHVKLQCPEPHWNDDGGEHGDQQGSRRFDPCVFPKRLNLGYRFVLYPSNTTTSEHRALLISYVTRMTHLHRAVEPTSS